MPAASPPVYAHPSNEHPRRGAFATKQLWVTPYSDDEKFPAGDYPLLAGDTNNIANWTSLVQFPVLQVAGFLPSCNLSHDTSVAYGTQNLVPVLVIL